MVQTSVKLTMQLLPNRHPPAHNMPGLAGDTDGDATRRFMLLQKKTFAEKKQPLKHTLYVAVFENNG